MTKEEALFKVEGYLTYYLSPNDYKEVEEIINALNQEPCEDAISRQAVIDMAITIKTDDYSGNEIMEVVDINDVKSLSSVTTQEPRWIPCSERYPQIEDEYKYFLVTDDKGKVSVQEFFMSLDEEPQPYFSGMVNVIAWMPLLKAYEPQERSDKE